MRVMTMRRAVFSGLALSLAVMSGCNQTPRGVREALVDYHTGEYARAAAVLKPAAAKKDENYVLNNCRYGSCTLAAGDLPEAQRAFYTAYEVMNSVKVNDPGRTAGAAIVFEGVKVWKGEPFEQAMAHYYLGMIFLIQHDYGSARAAFENSLFKVREYASKDDLEHYQAVDSTFALGYFGKGFCDLRLGKTELAQASFKEAVRYNPGLAQLVADVQDPNVNTLIFVDAGHGPQKEGKGWYNEETAFGPSPAVAGPIPQVTVYDSGKAISRPGEQYSTVDTLAMAQEKRWQDIDTLRKVKAVVGTGAMAAGAGMTAYGAEHNKKNLEWAGLGTMVAGALIAASSQADLRAWGLLPRTVYIIPASLTPGQHVIGVVAGPAQSAPLVTTIPAPAPGGPKDNVFYFRLR